MNGDGEQRIARLQGWRNRRKRDEPGLKFMQEQFKREVARPYKQLGELAGLWIKHMPVELAERTALRSFARGTLNVRVTDSATLYQLDRALRGGLERQLRQSFKGTLRRVKLEVEAGAGEKATRQAEMK